MRRAVGRVGGREGRFLSQKQADRGKEGMSDEQSKRGRVQATARERAIYGFLGRNRGPSARDENWLERRVRDMYQEVVDEPVPDEILGILNRIPKPDR
jgi:hypothetical protein